MQQVDRKEGVSRRMLYREGATNTNAGSYRKSSRWVRRLWQDTFGLSFHSELFLFLCPSTNMLTQTCTHIHMYPSTLPIVINHFG